MNLSGADPGVFTQDEMGAPRYDCSFTCHGFCLVVVRCWAALERQVRSNCSPGGDIVVMTRRTEVVTDGEARLRGSWMGRCIKGMESSCGGGISLSRLEITTSSTPTLPTLPTLPALRQHAFLPVCRRSSRLRCRCGRHLWCSCLRCQLILFLQCCTWLLLTLASTAKMPYGQPGLVYL